MSTQTPLTDRGVHLTTTKVISSGRRLEMNTWTDISPEVALLAHMRAMVQSVRGGVPHRHTPLHSNWRRRLCHFSGPSHYVDPLVFVESSE